jgi:hypothetical protein
MVCGCNTLYQKGDPRQGAPGCQKCKARCDKRNHSAKGKAGKKVRMRSVRGRGTKQAHHLSAEAIATTHEYDDDQAMMIIRLTHLVGVDVRYQITAQQLLPFSVKVETPGWQGENPAIHQILAGRCDFLFMCGPPYSYFSFSSAHSYRIATTAFDV